MYIYIYIYLYIYIYIFIYIYIYVCVCVWVGVGVGVGGWVGVCVWVGVFQTLVLKFNQVSLGNHFWKGQHVLSHHEQGVDYSVFHCHYSLSNINRLIPR